MKGLGVAMAVALAGVWLASMVGRYWLILPVAALFALAGCHGFAWLRAGRGGRP